MPAALTTTYLPFPVRRGKVRDVYDLGDALLIIATDRISAFDCIMPNGIPDKGKILTALSLFWFEKFGGQYPHHLIATEVADYPERVRPFADQLRGRSMLVKKASVVPIECVARGYLAGSGWKEYQKAQTVCGVALPPGLKQCDKLLAPIFTPATKEESGHDVNVTFEDSAKHIEQWLLQHHRTMAMAKSTMDTARDLTTQLRDRTIALYQAAADYAATRGVIIADTKFEFGLLPDGSLIVVDEVLTPDSSRFWPADTYVPGRDQDSFDKQFVRNYLESLTWDKQPPAPPLSEPVVDGTRARYIQAYEKLTGERWPAV